MIRTHVLVSSLAVLAPLWLASAPSRMPIRWDTPPGCVDPASVPAQVEALVGERGTAAGSLVLAAEQHGEAWRISLVLEPLGGEPPLRRTLEGRDCTTLTEAVALVVAVHLDAVASADGLAREEASDGAERDGSGVPPVDGVTRETPGEGMPREGSNARGPAVAIDEGAPSMPAAGSRDDRTSRPRPRALASFGVAGEVGVQPRAGAVFELAGGVGWPRARVELGALASVGPDAVSERLADVGGRFRLFTGLVRGCGVPGRERIELPLCGGLELGDLRASGTGLRRPATVDAPWIAVVASARPQWLPRLRSAGAADGSRARLAVGALLDLVVPLRRYRFATSEAGLVHAVEPVAVRLGVRVELRLP
jgi:hypothetical protein